VAEGVRARAGLAAALVLVSAPLLFWRGGVLEEEAIGFLGNYWGDRPVARRILDPRGYDFYQGRELSYAVDFLDAQWTRLVLGSGRTWFVAPSAVLATLGVVAAWWRLVPRALPALGRTTSLLLLLVYLGNFAVASTNGLLYRSAKPLVPPLLVALLLFTLAERRQPRAAPATAFAVAFGLGLGMSLLDRQGLFYVAVLAAALAVAWRRDRRPPPAILLGLLAAIAAALFYNYVLGPWLVHSANGYWPSLRFQRIRPARLLLPHLWGEALRLLGDWTSVLLGGLPAALLGTAAAGLGVGYVVRGGRDRVRDRGRNALALGLVAGAQVAMVAIMVERHEPVTWVDHRAWYYPLPFQVALLVGIAWGLERLAVFRPSSGRAVTAALLALLASNLGQWPARAEVMASGPWFGDVVRRSARLERSLETGAPDALLDGDYRVFFFDCLDRFPRLRARAGPLVREGDGVARVEVRDGRLFAWARRESHLTASAPSAGRYRLSGALWLRPGEAVSLLQGPNPPRLLAEVSRTAATEGAERLALDLALPEGQTDLLLLSRLPETEVRRGRERAPVAFGLLLPFALTAARPSETGVTPQPGPAAGSIPR
jgi:hypothetical protein